MRVAAILAAATVALATPLPIAPGLPGTDSARSELNNLQVADSGSTDGYSRKEFPHWIKVDGPCTAREYVLKRDGEGVQTSSTCKVESGSWTSPYDGTTWDTATELDIDHMVPLENAWISGAAAWTKAQRQDFANDIKRPQLWAVSAKSNRSKGDRSPDSWKPPMTNFHCTYAKAWVQVKSYYKLTVTGAEKSALGDMLNSC